MDSVVIENSSAPTVAGQPLPALSLEPSVNRFRTPGAIFGCLALLMLSFVIGLYASAINQEFYVHHSPFFDSCSYYNI